MTVKEQFTATMSNNQFQNPENKPVEELKLKYRTSDSSYEELIPALDERWCNKDFVYTLYKPPPCKNSDGEYTLGSKEDWLERMSLLCDDMITLLQLQYHRFWSEAIYNSHSLDGLSSFLQNAPPFYLRDQIPQDRDILKALKKVQELMFLVLMRLTKTKESEFTKILQNACARSVLIAVAKEVSINNVHSAAGCLERALSNSDCLLVSSASPTEL
ncbi:Activating signal cointegrator 1 complex subunit 2 [Homalodisca vitripennis]|nr:Activating signal cointegrator 1 complex subunit 2 [Homalodisca vitripennis]